MYASRYAEYTVPTPAEARENERRAIDRSIEQLRRARDKGPMSRESIEAILYLQTLWTFFIEELNSNQNLLSPELRASLISIGIWLLRESDEIRLERSVNYDGLIGVSEIIRNSLVGPLQ